MLCNDGRRDLIDARGVFLAFVCDACEEEKRRAFRPDIFIDWPIEKD